MRKEDFRGPEFDFGRPEFDYENLIGVWKVYIWDEGGDMCYFRSYIEYRLF